MQCYKNTSFSSSMIAADDRKGGTGGATVSSVGIPIAHAHQNSVRRVTASGRSCAARLPAVPEIRMATSEIPAAVIPPVPGPEPGGVSAAIPTSGSAISAEVTARHAAIVDKFTSLDSAPPLVAVSCQWRKYREPCVSCFLTSLWGLRRSLDVRSGQGFRGGVSLCRGGRASDTRLSHHRGVQARHHPRVRS